MAQLMLLAPTVSSFSKVQIGLTFLVLDKRPLNGCCSCYNWKLCTHCNRVSWLH